MPRRAHVPKTAGGATGGSLAHERAATELDRQGSLLLGLRAVPTTARALQQAAHPCLDPHDEREDGGRLVERQPLGVHLEGDRISHLQFNDLDHGILRGQSWGTPRAITIHSSTRECDPPSCEV